MTAEKDGGYAFACAGTSGYQPGMTLRDYFAGQAMAAILAHIDLADTSNNGSEISSISYQIADNMLAARQPQETTE